ncbi:uncharacterized protein EV422DRAFT_614442 [Fimicolochytrium jonesii]|uniref:uncharacterized protein n=1 Tax=Fimicolochytrium jonesii TaxID=1396493 RepID=UPI0022FE88F8|nr:uncharacterized protein EV422DRAFT_614442 [Fimicolochytrium jonesii]KAI8822073.1 hypothetical protein EV422DRAFT_614442 [Fimicolochytrium jonesii]
MEDQKDTPVQKNTNRPPTPVPDADDGINKVLDATIKERQKKPRTAAQLEALKRAQQKRAENLRKLTKMKKEQETEEAKRRELEEKEAEKERARKIIEKYEREKEKAKLKAKEERAARKAERHQMAGVEPKQTAAKKKPIAAAQPQQRAASPELPDDLAYSSEDEATTVSVPTAQSIPVDEFMGIFGMRWR